MKEPSKAAMEWLRMRARDFGVQGPEYNWDQLVRALDAFAEQRVAEALRPKVCSACDRVGHTSDQCEPDEVPRG